MKMQLAMLQEAPNMKIKVTGWVTPDGYDGTRNLGTAYKVDLTLDLGDLADAVDGIASLEDASAALSGIARIGRALLDAKLSVEESLKPAKPAADTSDKGGVEP